MLGSFEVRVLPPGGHVVVGRWVASKCREQWRAFHRSHSTQDKPLIADNRTSRSLTQHKRGTHIP